MKQSIVFRFIAVGAIGAVLFFSIDFVAVAFLGGINFQLGDFVFRSTTIEFPIIGLWVSSLLLPFIFGRIKEGVLLCCSLILALGLVEIGLRIIDHPFSRPLINFNRWYEPSELYGHQLVRNFEGLGPLQVPVKINSFGFRDIEHPKHKDDQTIRILGLGDSFTFGWGVSLENTYLKQLETTMLQATGRSVETINTGVPGWGLNQYYICLKEFGIQFTPDIIMVGYWPDDLNGPPVDKLGPVPNAQWEAESHIRMRGGLLHHSRLFNFFTYLADQIKYKNRSKRIPHLHDAGARRAEWAKNPDFLIADSGQDITDKRSKLLKDHLSRINALAATYGAPLIVLFIPDYSQLFHPEFQHINRIIRAISHELGIAFLDMTPLYEATEESHSNYFWPLDGHTNEVGHQAIAQALIPVLCERLNKKPATCQHHSNQRL